MKLLLHTCCAPCLIHPLETLRAKGYEVTGLFYNPNIHPFAEYENRKHALAHLSSDMGVEILYPEYSPAEYFRAINLKEAGDKRCAICWALRLKTTAEFAKARGFSHFSSTLLVSPYQDQEMLKNIGYKIAGQEEVEFYYEDFRPGFRKTHDEAKARGIYCQKYCGCIYSEIERCKKSEKH